MYIDILWHTSHRSCSLYCASVQIVKLPLTSLKDSFLYTDWWSWLQCSWVWSSLISLFHLKTAALISPGYTTPPLSLQPFTGAVSASHHDYMTKFGAAGYVPSAKYSRYLPQPDRLPNKLNTFVLSGLWLSVRFYISFLFLTHLSERRSLFCMLRYLLIKENPSPWSIYKKGIHQLLFEDSK